MLVKIVILMFTLSFILAYDKSSVNKIFENLNKQKFNKIEVSNLANPFQKIDLNITKVMPHSLNSRVSEIKKEEQVIPKLQVIFNDKVKLEDKWYKLGDEIFGFKIVKIKVDSVVLENEKGKEILSLIKSNQAVRIFNEVH